MVKRDRAIEAANRQPGLPLWDPSNAFPIAMRVVECLIVGMFGFLVLERCNMIGNAKVLQWVAKNPLFFIVEIIVLISLYGLFRAFFRRPVLPFAIYGALIYLIGAAHFYKLFFRSEPLIPYDLFNIRPAFSIAGNMSLFYDRGLALNLFLYGFCLLLLWLIQKLTYDPEQTRSIFKGVIVFILSALCLTVLTNFTRLEAIGVEDKRFDQYNNYKDNGFVIATLLNLSLSTGVTTPAGYGAETVGELRVEIEDAGRPVSLGRPPKPPHIVVLQMESYADPAHIDPRIRYRQSPFEPLAPYAGEIQRFFTLTSVLGGGTANTEYELLTGYNMYFCPLGVIPFVRYVSGPQPGLVADLNDLGYRAVAVHPHKGSFYSRDSVFPAFGFQRYVTIADFINPVYADWYISDASFGEKIIEVFEEEKMEGPVFLFGISIQNHGPYNIPDIQRTFPVDLSDGLALNESQISELETFGANIYDSSVMLANMIRYFSSIDDPVLLLVYGDHQVAWSWVHDLPGGPELDMRRYSVESFFCANYPLMDDGRTLISVSGLGPRIMRKAGLELPLYMKGIDLQFRELLAYNIAVTVENDGEVNYVTPDRVEPFRLLQYDRMFGRNYLETQENN